MEITNKIIKNLTEFDEIEFSVEFHKMVDRLTAKGDDMSDFFNWRNWSMDDTNGVSNELIHYFAVKVLNELKNFEITRDLTRIHIIDETLDPWLMDYKKIVKIMIKIISGETACRKEDWAEISLLNDKFCLMNWIMYLEREYEHDSNYMILNWDWAIFPF